MFDDPKKELQRLQDRLLAAEKKDSPPPVKEDPDAALAEVKKILARDDWENTSREPLRKKYIPYAEAVEEAAEDGPAETSKTTANALWIALIVELLAMAAVMIGWLLWR